MTFTLTSESPTAAPADRLRPVPFDLYKDIHKGIRAALFAVTAEAGRVDPADHDGVIALEREVADVVRLLAGHAAHEDDHLDLVRFLPDIAEQVAADHEELEARMAHLVDLAAGARSAAAPERRFAVHELYIELASFTGAYLIHQDMEERVIMPALADRLPIDQLIGIHNAIIGGMPPEELVQGTVAIFPAVNVEDRCEMLAGMRAEAPPEAFAGLWGLAASLLAPEDAAEVARRLGL